MLSVTGEQLASCTWLITRRDFDAPSVIVEDGTVGWFGECVFIGNTWIDTLNQDLKVEPMYRSQVTLLSAQ